MNMPLRAVSLILRSEPIVSPGGVRFEVRREYTYHAAPTTDRPMQSPIPISAQAYGETSSRNWPNCGNVRMNP
jgi:hypothetical protein